ncbi:MAG: class I SAM-dependent methyltransferase [Desulfovibrionaceae bacterium]|nr:class I SAM-dependent methyltransferase [Desulfovibrionaceae bacterium]
MLNPSALLETAHAVWERHAGPLMLDATAGNGRDTAFLAALTGEDGIVLAMDRQNEALIRTAALLRERGLERRARLLLANHADMAEALARQMPDASARLDLAVFNLGFLPGGDKRVVSSAATTLAALNPVWEWLRPGGLLSVHAYSGHPGGADEMDAVGGWMRAKNWREAQVSACVQWNKARHPETLWLAVKNAR